MYIGDHIVLSATVGIMYAKRFNMPLIEVITLFIFVNIIDYDHLIYYKLDDGTANSLALHPLHLYFGSIAFALAVLSMIYPKYLYWIYAVLVGISTHLFSDAIAHLLQYELPRMFIITGIQLIIFFIVSFLLLAKKSRTLFIGYVAFCLVFTDLSLLYMRDVLHWTSDNFYGWASQPTIALFACIINYCFFKRTLSFR